jgi:hypothetical protein
MLKTNLEEAIAEFRFSAAPLVLTSNRNELKQLYARLTVACINDPEAASKMRQELIDVVLAPSRNVGFDTFNDL